MTDPLATIQALTQSANTPISQPASPALSSFWECQGCGKTGEGPFPATCTCGARCWPGKTPEEAHARVMRVMWVKGVAPAAPATEPTPTPAPVPGPTPVPVAQAPATTTPATQSPRRGRKPKAETPAPVAQPPVAQVPVDPAPQAPVDYAALRAAFATHHRLTHDAWTQVGEAQVETVGFTLWLDVGGQRRPSYRFMEPLVDTPESFRASFDKFRVSNPNLRLDVLRCNHVQPQDLKAISFQGELTVNRNAGDGPLVCAAGDTIIIGARLSQSGSVIFAALGKKEII